MKTRDICPASPAFRSLASSGRAMAVRAACRAFFILSVGIGLVPACADQIPTAIKGCPCAAGNVCCSSGVCAASQDACSASALGLARAAQGVWAGYFENFSFPSGSDSLEIVLSLAAAEPSATVKMGADGTPPLAVEWAPTGGLSIDPNTLKAQTKEGFTYQARDLRWESQRLKFTVRFGDPWTDHCAGYPPITIDEYTFYCPGYWTRSSSTNCTIGVRGSVVPVDCTLLDRCFLDPYCACSENACIETNAQASLDIALQGDLADGSLIFNGTPINVRLARLNR
jgi:hypothetical protein